MVIGLSHAFTYPKLIQYQLATFPNITRSKERKYYKPFQEKQLGLLLIGPHAYVPFCGYHYSTFCFHCFFFINPDTLHFMNCINQEQLYSICC